MEWAAIWEGQWFQIRWADTERIVANCGGGSGIGEMLGRLHGAVRCMCKNEAVVSFIMTKSGKEGQMAHMLRCLFFLEASFGFAVVVAHVPGSLNAWVDAFSCNHLDVFRTLRT